MVGYILGKPWCPSGTGASSLAPQLLAITSALPGSASILLHLSWPVPGPLSQGH